MQLRFNFSPQNFKIRSTFLSLEERGLELKCWDQDHSVGWEPKWPNTQLSTLSSSWSCLTRKIKFLKRLILSPHPLSRVIMFWGWNKVQEHQQLSPSNSPRSRNCGALCQGYVRSHPETISHWVKDGRQKLGMWPQSTKINPMFRCALKLRREFSPDVKVQQWKKSKLHGSGDSDRFRNAAFLEIWVIQTL